VRNRSGAMNAQNHLPFLNNSKFTSGRIMERAPSPVQRVQKPSLKQKGQYC